MKKLLKLFMVLVMLIVQVLPVRANDDLPQTKPGSITIINAIADQTYDVYRIFDLETYDNEKEAYTYKVNSAWSGFISGAGRAYVDVDAQGYVTWKENADVVAFSKAALAYAKDPATKIDATSSKKATSDKVEFTNLDLGYYLVDSSLGALCGLNTTRPSVEIKEKNTTTTMKKEVEEGQIWGNESDAKIGDTISYKITITANTGAENYVLKDKMTEGLTFNNDIKIELNTTENEQNVTKDVVLTTDYKFVTDANYTFVIDFEKTFEDTLKQGDEIVVTYTATLNEKAVIYDNANVDHETDANINTATFVYGDNNVITNTTRTYSYKFDVVKIDQDGKLLKGAKFKLYDREKDGNEIKLVFENGVYRVAVEGETGVDIDLTQIEYATIVGLNGNTTYYLEEIKQPDGYNILAGRVSVPIKTENIDARFAASGSDESAVTGGVQVENVKGNLLPDTGGIGTVIFITVGSIMVLGFGLLLVAKLRLSKEEL